MSGVVFLKDRELLDVTPVENIFIAQFMPSAPEIAVKAYLYGLMLLNSPHAADEDIAAALSCTETDIRAAFSYWQSAGIIRVIGEEPLRVQYLNIKASLGSGRVDTSGAAHGDFVRRIQEAAGTRMMTGAELKKLYDWLDVFGFEEDAAVELFRRCLDTKGAKTSVSYMDAVARTLAGKAALTKGAVEEHFREEELLRSGAASILKRWNRRSAPTEDQLSLYEKWTRAWGFDEAVIDAALTKMTSAERMTFSYLDSILTDWHDKGLVDISAVDESLKREDMTAELTRQAFSRAGLISKPTAEQRRLIGSYYYDKHMSAELILFASELSAKDAKPFAKLKNLLADWRDHGIGSVSEAREYNEKQVPAIGRRRSGRSRDIIRGGDYSEEELKKLGISMGEEFYGKE